MTLTSTRNKFRADGIFGVTTDQEGKELFVSLEHAYQQPDGSYAPKMLAGTYTCKRGVHLLKDASAPFETFEVLDVPGHTNILFPHPGNYNNDSEGCTLCGVGVSIDTNTKALMITGSRLTFQKFMDTMTGIDEFTLIVKDEK